MLLSRSGVDLPGGFENDRMVGDARKLGHELILIADDSHAFEQEGDGGVPESLVDKRQGTKARIILVLASLSHEGRVFAVAARSVVGDGSPDFVAVGCDLRENLVGEAKYGGVRRGRERLHVRDKNRHHVSEAHLRMELPNIDTDDASEVDNSLEGSLRVGRHFGAMRRDTTGKRRRQLRV